MRRPVGEYVGRKEAARLLDVSVRTVCLWTRKGLLTPRFIGDRKEMHFRVTDLQMLRLARADKGTNIWEVKALALQALATAQTAELRLAELFEHLGLNATPLDRSPAGISALCKEVGDYMPAHLRDPRWLRHWGNVFFAVDEVYLELVTHATGDDEPWKRFMDFTNNVRRAAPSAAEALQASEELRLAFKYFEGGARHLWYVGYMHCRRVHGRRVADTVFNGSVSAVDELMAILH